MNSFFKNGATAITYASVLSILLACVSRISIIDWYGGGGGGGGTFMRFTGLFDLKGYAFLAPIGFHHFVLK